MKDSIIKNKKTAMLMVLEKYLEVNDKEKAKIIAEKLKEFEIINYEELNNNDSEKNNQC